MLVSTYILAQSTSLKLDKPVLCDETKKVFHYLITEHKEQPIWGGIGEETRFILLVNKENTTWSIIQFSNETACMLGSGEGYQLLNVTKEKLVKSGSN